MVVRDISSFLPLRGGILAEEMGLGKTVELIALICLHTRKLATGTQVLDHFSGNTVTATGGTLIITPNAILEQWKNELSTHAPHLKVFHYQGLPTASADKPGQAPSVKDLLEYDVVLTTYHVLSREVHYAKPAPERSFRNSKKYEPRRSPLVQLSWWRVCLDEAQMVESGVSQAATVARLLPRCNAWAVSGTPLRKDIQDLRGLLIFLRYEPYSSSTQHWKRVDKATFKEIFGHIAMRHTKDKVRHELRLPPQKRVVITVPFTTIEEQNYSELMQQMCTACGFSPDGDFLDENGNPQNPNVLEKMREWLVRLRQTCLHAEVGIKNRRALGRGNGPLRTVEEVLEVMIEQTDTAVKAGEREVVLAQLEKGHVIANNKSDDHRSENALKVYLAALKQASQFVVENRDLQTKLEKQDSTSMPKGRSVSVGSGDDTDGEERGKHEHGSQHHTHLATIKKSLRSVLELEHACNFFVGTSYYRIKSDEKLTKPESEEFHNLENKETEFYDKAKAIRNELLQDSKESAMRRMKKIEAKSVKNGFARVPQVKELTGFGGIENRKVLDAMDRLSALMNDQAAQIEEWRKKIVEILLKPLVDEDDGKETTGDEYEDSTKVQDELYVNISALRAMVADRHLAVTGLKNDLIDHEMRFTRNQALEGKGHAPELLLKLLESRDKLRPGVKEGSLKGAISSVRALETNLQWQADGGNLRAKNELLIVQDQLAQIQAISSAQTKAVADLEKDLILFGMTMNRRLEYYRQLQHISDTVAPWKEELDEQLDEAALAKQQQREVQAGDNLRRVESKRRYLLTIREGNDKADDQQRICKICTDEIEVGVLTICGHQYCKECIQAWYNARRTCPVSKMPSFIWIHS
jgi:E3 ubiquitin-protein ligase SHPRH